MAIQAPKGTKDLLPMDSYKWHYIEDKLKKLSCRVCIKRNKNSCI